MLVYQRAGAQVCLNSDLRIILISSSGSNVQKHQAIELRSEAKSTLMALDFEMLGFTVHTSGVDAFSRQVWTLRRSSSGAKY